MITTGTQKQLARKSQAISLVSQKDDAYPTKGPRYLYNGEKTLFCKISQRVQVKETGEITLRLPITPVMIQDKLNAWNTEILNEYGKPGLYRTVQAYLFAGWSAAVRVCALNTGVSPFVPTVSVGPLKKDSPDNTRQDKPSSVIVTSLVEDGAFKPHVVEGPRQTQVLEKSPLFSKVVAREIFSEETTTTVVTVKDGQESIAKEKILGKVFNGDVIEQWKFADKDTFLTTATYPVFGELIIEAYAKKGATLVVQVDVAFQVDTTIEKSIYISTQKPTYHVLNSVFSGEASSLSGETLIMPGPWLIGEERYNELSTPIQEKNKGLTLQFSSCILTIRNPTNTETNVVLNVMTPTQENEEEISIEIPTEGTTDGFGIVPNQDKTIATIKGIEGVVTETWSLSIKSRETLVFRFQNNSLTRKITSSNVSFPYFRYKVNLNLMLIDKGKDTGDYISSGSVNSPWIQEEGNSLIFPYLLSLSIAPGPLAISVTYTLLGRSGK